MRHRESAPQLAFGGAPLLLLLVVFVVVTVEVAGREPLEIPVGDRPRSVLEGG